MLFMQTCNLRFMLWVWIFGAKLSYRIFIVSVTKEHIIICLYISIYTLRTRSKDQSFTATVFRNMNDFYGCTEDNAIFVYHSKQLHIFVIHFLLSRDRWILQHDFKCVLYVCSFQNNISSLLQTPLFFTHRQYNPFSE